MRFLTLILAGFLVVGCAEKNPKEIRVCDEGEVKNCSQVVYFLPDSDVIGPYAQDRLDWTVEKMKQWPKKKALITAYSDEEGGDEYNMELSKRRAKSVGQLLVNKGIDSSRVRVRYAGNKEPICLTPECKNLNRRVTIEIYNL